MVSIPVMFSFSRVFTNACWARVARKAVRSRVRKKLVARYSTGSTAKLTSESRQSTRSMMTT